MSKTKNTEKIMFPIGTNVHIKALKLFGKIKGYCLGKYFTEYTVQVLLSGKLQKMFFKEDELEVI